jgi:hypothetical protein
MMWDGRFVYRIRTARENYGRQIYLVGVDPFLDDVAIQTCCMCQKERSAKHPELRCWLFTFGTLDQEILRLGGAIPQTRHCRRVMAGLQQRNQGCGWNSMDNPDRVFRALRVRVSGKQGKILKRGTVQDIIASARNRAVHRVFKRTVYCWNRGNEGLTGLLNQRVWKNRSITFTLTKRSGDRCILAKRRQRYCNRTGYEDVVVLGAGR